MIIEQLKLLTDIKNSIENIGVHLNFTYDYNDYISNITKQRAVERELEIIGEATNKLIKIDPSISISFSRVIVDLRNKIIHSYDNVNNVVLWKVIIKDVPILLAEVNVLLQSNK